MQVPQLDNRFMLLPPAALDGLTAYQGTNTKTDIIMKQIINVQVILDLIMLVCCVVYAVKGETFPAWMMAVWVSIALIAHTDKMREEN